MKYLKNEKGYALIVVLFAVVLISVITVVFMRGALNNRTQESTADENNLVVVSAESGLEYYTFKLKQVYDEEVLDEKFKSLETEAHNAKVAAAELAKKNGVNYVDEPIDYVKIQEKIVGDFLVELEQYKDDLSEESAVVLNENSYTHKLVGAEILRSDKGGDVFLTVKGKVRGELLGSSKKKELEFEYTYIFPGVELESVVTPIDPIDPDSPTPTGNSIVVMPTLKDLDGPKSVVPVVGINKQLDDCTPSGTETKKRKCNASGISQASYRITESSMFIENTLNSWGSVSLENSFVNIRGSFTPARFDIKNTELVVGNEIDTYQDVTINGSKVHVNKSFKTKGFDIKDTELVVDNEITANDAVVINGSEVQANKFNNSGGTAKITDSQMNITTSLLFQKVDTENSIISTNMYKVNTEANFTKTDLKVTNFESSRTSFKNSNLEVGENLTMGGGLFYAEDSNVKIVGNAHTANGSTIKNSVLNIGGYFKHTSKPLDAINSDIFVGGDVTSTNATDLDRVNMNVLGNFETNGPFKLVQTNLRIAKILKLTNGGTLNDSLLIAKGITITTPSVLNDSIVSVADDISTTNHMTINNSKICVNNMVTNGLTMDKNSKVYYRGTSNHKAEFNDKFIKDDGTNITSNKCGTTSQAGPADPEEPIGPPIHEVVDWIPPALEKVTY